jgi:hypothetical protein
VKFNDHPKKKISFDDGDEDTWIDASDDDAKCRC